MFFVDLPSYEERKEIFHIHLTKRGRDPRQFDLGALSEMTNGYSGSEIENVVIDALYNVYFAHKGAKDISTNDIITAISETKPLSELAAEKTKELRDWAKDRAKYASAQKEEEVVRPRPIAVKPRAIEFVKKQ